MGVKILFLDVDGVLNCKSTRVNDEYGAELDPYMVLLVDRIVQKTGCEIVLSSAWRLHEPDRERVAAILPIKDVTPHYPGRDRGLEIDRWLSQHPEVTKYAILDDYSDMLPEQLPNFFQTTWETGLTEDMQKRVIDHLYG